MLKSSASTIWQATLPLMLNEKKSFRQLSVAEICQNASIHRSSFYRTFTDKFALLEFGIEELWEKYYQELDSNNLSTPFQTADAFFENSESKLFLKSQQTDEQMLEDIKNLTLKQLERYYAKQLDEKCAVLIAGFIISAINYIDQYGDKQKVKLTPIEKDQLFKNMVMPLFLEHQKST